MRDIKVGEVWVGTHYKICINKADGALIIKRIDDTIIDEYAVALKGLFKLQQKEYSLMEALDALEQGKEIQSTVGGKYKYKKINDKYAYYSCSNEKWFTDVETTMSMEEILGKWHIND